MSKKLYRVLQAIQQRNGDRIPAGYLGPLPQYSPSNLAGLIERGVISEVVTAPLAILPGWKDEAERLADIQVETVADLLDTDNEDIAEKLDITHVEVGEVKEDVMKWLRPSDEEYVPFTNLTLAEYEQEVGGLPEVGDDVEEGEVTELAPEDMVVVHLKGEIAKSLRRG